MFNFSDQFVTASSWEKGPYRELVYGGDFDDLGRVELFPYGFVWMLHTED